MTEKQDADHAGLEERLKRSIGATSVSYDTVTAAPVGRLAATLDCEQPASNLGEPLPLGWHCLFCLPQDKMMNLEPDGLPRHSYPIPAVPFSRRLFGGAKIEFCDHLRIGDDIQCEVRLSDIALKQGKAGPMVIATLERHYETTRGVALIERQEIVHLNGSPAGKPPPRSPSALPSPTWEQTIATDPILLFRYSALSFNSHRIHYDTPYAKMEESLPGMVVQGKLLSLLMLESIRRFQPDYLVKHFEYRSTRPVYCGESIAVCGHVGVDRIDLWIANEQGDACQKGIATAASSGGGE